MNVILQDAYNREVHSQHLLHSRYSDTRYIVWFLREGSLSIQIDGQSLNVSPGHWILCPPLTLRSHQFSPHSVLLSIRFTIRHLGLDFIPPLPRLHIVPAQASGELMRLSKQLCDLFVKGCAHPNDASPEQQFSYYQTLYAWLGAWYPLHYPDTQTTPRDIDARVQTLIAMLSTRTGLGVVHYDDLCTAVGLSRAQIDRLLKREIGLTPRQWMEARCQTEAEELLTHSQRSIKEIAAHLRFVDGAHFSKWFKRRTGVTPSHVRRGFLTSP